MRSHKGSVMALYKRWREIDKWMQIEKLSSQQEMKAR